MKPKPFGCDIRSCSVEEKEEFLELLNKYEGEDDFAGLYQYYGIRADGEAVGISFQHKWTRLSLSEATDYFTCIIPISEGIQILKATLKSIAEEKININEMLEYPIQITNNRMCTLLIPKDTTPAELTTVQAFIEALKPN